MKRIKKIIYQLILPTLKISKYISWLLYLKTEDEIKIVVGAGPTNYKSWFSTDIDTLDITNEKDFKKYFTKKRINKILAEHVLEHLTDNELELIAHNFYKYSENDINVRIAVPDGFHTDTKYIDRVKPGGTGYGADDHKSLFNYESLSQIFEKVGFKTKLIEYWDEFGIFTTKYKNDENGYIKRSFINDDRNKNGKPNYTSLIVDFSKIN
jgi:predicted SAM-dependent methyltransferase